MPTKGGHSRSTYGMLSDEDFGCGRQAGDDGTVSGDVPHQVTAIRKLHHGTLVGSFVDCVQLEHFGRPFPARKVLGLRCRERKRGVISKEKGQQ